MFVGLGARAWVLGAVAFLVVLGVALGVASALGSGAGPGVVGASAEPAPEGSCGFAVEGLSGPRVPHPPVRIDGDDINEQPVLAQGTGPAPAAYRPGSGIVAGDGSEADPYLVTGWRVPRVTIQNTEAHVVVADNVFDPRLEPTGTAIDPDQASGILPRVQGRPDVGVSRVQNATNVTIVGNLGQGNFDVGRAPGFCFGANEVSPWTGGDSLEVCRSPGARVLGNTELKGLSVRWSPHLEIAGNAFLDRGIDLETTGCALRLGPPPPDEGPAFYDHEITPGNTVDGEPIRYLQGVSNLTVREPVAQVLVHNSTNVTAADASLGRTDISYSPGVALRNVSTGEEDPVAFLDSPGSSLANASLGEWSSITVRGSPNVTVVDSRAEFLDGLIVVTSDDATIAGNRFGGAPKPLVGVSESHRVEVHENVLLRGEVGLELDGVREASVRNNTVDHGSSIGMDLRGTSNATVVDNVVRRSTVGMLLSDSGEVSHNLLEGGEGVSYRGAILYSGKPDSVALGENVFRNYSYAVTVHWHDGGNEVSGNNLGEGVGMGVQLVDGETLDASGNWWGCPEGPDHEDCADVEGDVTVDPFLGEPNPDAGPRG